MAGICNQMSDQLAKHIQFQTMMAKIHPLFQTTCIRLKNHALAAASGLCFSSAWCLRRLMFLLRQQDKLDFYTKH